MVSCVQYMEKMDVFDLIKKSILENRLDSVEEARAQRTIEKSNPVAQMSAIDVVVHTWC